MLKPWDRKVSSNELFFDILIGGAVFVELGTLLSDVSLIFWFQRSFESGRISGYETTILLRYHLGIHGTLQPNKGRGWSEWKLPGRQAPTLSHPHHHHCSVTIMLRSRLAFLGVLISWSAKVQLATGQTECKDSGLDWYTSKVGETPCMFSLGFLGIISPTFCLYRSHIWAAEASVQPKLWV